ncbi:Protein OBERON 1 [Apostasia shenzhenica]|uniref:Protein OBERON 1 n=1 Tax=Apostasia shenzhenica TaxID=1088818 RepID=A0A2I0AML6_9ASPA|nr:Protein OBERON 1 [Apostasia shenzhenica]
MPDSQCEQLLLFTMVEASKSMDIYQMDGSNGKTNLLKLNCIPEPVPAGASGIGLPYAPADWPNPGDMWTWKVGHRKANKGYWVDRYICAPSHLPKFAGRRANFQSRLSLEQYIRKEFPDADVDAFFASFIWKVPIKCTKDEENLIHMHTTIGSLKVNECPGSESIISPGGCKAGNQLCIRASDNECQLKTKTCDICCSEAGFCHDCCCILCSKSVDFIQDGFNIIRCQVVLEENLTCGHVSHLDCALRAYMAGTVGGSIGLDAEYYCRHCDNKSDLVPHVIEMTEACESLESCDVTKILNAASRILGCSEKTRAKILCNRIGIALEKLNRGIHPSEIWSVENGISDDFKVPCSRSINMLESMENSKDEAPTRLASDTKQLFRYDAAEGHLQEPIHLRPDQSVTSVKLEDEIEEALQRLKISQQFEYRLAEEKLYAQKNVILNLYQQIRVEKVELVSPKPWPSGSVNDALLTTVFDKFDQIKVEEIKLKEMLGIASGFARTPRSILRKHFCISLDE